MLEFDIRRSKKLNAINYSGGNVVYWMQRDRRFHNNWALIHAQNIAIKYKVPLTVFYSLNGNFANANPRQYGFLLRGLSETIKVFKKHNIPFHLRRGDVLTSLHNYISSSNTGYLITDFSPLKVYKKRLNKIIEDLSSLTVVEAAELSKQLEEKWGVTAATAVAAAPALSLIHI